ncbi:DUF6634 family protein [Methylobacterium radiodurans]|uniref:Uncharacterized protein n=1 Tax=Methylobacterium radiodurans TaxID=2202828 RepID=A0A2U8VV74_9HYPH|nr:DUF6634 family protein [Methylobacterium radiodurans]AWN37703.1 hypothetical protein DK427_19855 [Methylobacterium radiodurans]
MLLGFTGPGCLSANAHVALLATHAAAALGFSVQHVRVVGGAEPSLLPRLIPPRGGSFVERPAVAVARSIRGGFDLTIVDAGTGNLPRLGALPFDAVLVGAGPCDIEERRAASFAGSLPGHLSRVTWLLGLDRDGGEPELRRFEHGVRSALSETGTLRTPRILPALAPILRRADTDRLLAGRPSARVLGAGVALLASIASAVDAERGGTLEGPWSSLAEAVGGTRPCDRRDEAETLRALADDLERIADGGGPTAEDLAHAPVLEQWESAARITRCLVGVVGGHPNLPSGKQVRTSEVYATDGRSWARTLSRFYVLRTPRQELPSVNVH